MKKVQPSGAQSRKKKRAREEAESRQKEALDTWIKRSRVEVNEIMRQRRALQIPVWSQNTIIMVLFLSRLHVKTMISAEKKKEILPLFCKETILGI